MASVFADNHMSQEQASPAGGSFLLPTISLLSLLLLPQPGEIICVRQAWRCSRRCKSSTDRDDRNR